MVQAVDDSYEPLLAMGFEILQSFEEITSSPESVSQAIDLSASNGRR